MNLQSAHLFVHKSLNKLQVLREATLLIRDEQRSGGYDLKKKHNLNIKRIRKTNLTI